MSDRDFKINITGDASSAVQAAQQTASALGNAADETARYEAALRQMEIASRAADQAQRNLASAAAATTDESARYQASLEAMANRAPDAASKPLNPMDDWLAGVQERRTAIKAEGVEGKEAMEAVATATGKATLRKNELKSALNAIARAFPGIAMIARSVLNPITLSVTGLIAAFQIWETRIKNAMQVLGGIELPDISGQLKNYEAAADAWEKFATKVREVQEAYNGVIAASERIEKTIDKQAQTEKQRLENQKKIELAQLDLQKREMGEGEYAARRATLEGRYEQGEMAIEQRAEQRKLAEFGRRRGNLEIHAEWKEREARGITPPSEEAESQIDQLHQEQAEVAKAELQAAKARLKRLEAMSADPLERAKGTWWYFQTYGPSVHGAQARAMERENIARWQIPLDRFESWEGAKRTHAGERTRRGDLLDDAAGMRGEAWKLGQELPGLQQDFNQRRQLDAETAAANRFSRQAGAASTSNQEAAELNRVAAQAIESGHGLTKEMINTLNRVIAENENGKRQLAAEMANLRGAIGGLRR